MFARRSYLLQLFLRAHSRHFSTQAEGNVLGRWLQAWELATPPVADIPGLEAPTALSWLRRRGPPLSEAQLQKLFRTEVVRLWDPATHKVSRARKARPLPAGAQLLLPRAALAEAATQRAEQGEGAGAGSGSAGNSSSQRRDSPEQQAARMKWVRELRQRVLYHDADLLALNKPAGLAVQGGSGVDVSVDELMGQAFGGGRLVADGSQLRLVHRLDQATTGVLVLATSPDAAAWLSAGFRSGAAAAAAAAAAEGGGGSGGRDGPQVRKTYWAVVAKQVPRDIIAGWDQPEQELPQQGTIDLPVSAGAGGGGNWAAASPGRAAGGGRSGSQVAAGSAAAGGAGQAALTKFSVRHQDGELAWVELRPQTGRKHQLRMHAAQGLGAPVLGDTKYGAVREPPQRSVLQRLQEEGAWPERGRPPLFLHCRSILIRKPGGELVRLVAPPHPHWQALFAARRWGQLLAPPKERRARRQVSGKR